MVKCILCQRIYNKAFDISFHRFPSDKSTRKAWCQIMNHETILLTDRLCSQHFADDCFQVHKELGQRILKPYSVPTLALTKIEPKKFTCSLETVLTEHNYVLKPEECEKRKIAEPAKLFIKYPYVLNTPPCNITPNIIMPDVKFNIPMTYQPLVTNVPQSFSGNMMYALKINPPANRMEPVKPVIPRILQNTTISKNEEAKRRALAIKKKKEELKMHEMTLKKLQTVTKKMKDQRQTIKMLRQKLRRLEARFDMQKTLIKHLNTKLEAQVTMVAIN